MTYPPLLQPDLILKIAFGVLPVLAFLGALVILDSYKLVRVRDIFLSIAAGILSALASMYAGSFVVDQLQISFWGYSRWIAPFVEELFKASYLVFLIRSHRIGFAVDGAISGFGIGAGFAVVENIWYIGVLPDASLFVWLIRGFGTAVMHGGTVSIAAIVAKTLEGTDGRGGSQSIAPAIALAIGIHMFYNQFLISPIHATVIILLTLPLMMVTVFHQSERMLRRWLHVGFDTDQELLRMIISGNFSETPVGNYFHTLQERFRPDIVVDMVCSLRIHLELTIQAKGILIMREAGFDVPPAEDVREKFAELQVLTHAIGKTGTLALLPFLHTSGRELWQMHMLKKE